MLHLIPIIPQCKAKPRISRCPQEVQSVDQPEVVRLETGTVAPRRFPTYETEFQVDFPFSVLLYPLCISPLPFMVQLPLLNGYQITCSNRVATLMMIGLYICAWLSHMHVAVQIFVTGKGGKYSD